MNNGKPFEQAVRKTIETLGFTIERGPQPSGDGGVDMVVTYPSPMGTTRYVIQCKDTKSVGRPDIDQLQGTLHREQGHIGLMITTGKYTKDAQQAAKNHQSIRLIDGPKYQKLTTPTHTQKTIPNENRQITHDTIKRLNKIIDQEPTPMNITVETPTKLTKSKKKLAKRSGSLQLITTYTKPKKPK